MAIPDLAGAVVIVTGASSGMGEATARALHEAGALPVLDGLVNNAGASLGADVAEVDVDRFREVLELNVVAPVAVLQAVVPSMREHGGGTVVNVSSGTTRRVAVGLAPYASTKSALNTLSQAARAELADDAIDVALIVPFITATEFGGGMFSGPGAPTGERTPHSAEFVAAVILRMLRTGEERIDLLPGPEDWSLARVDDGDRAD